MADLIININFNESRKKQSLVIEVYEGIILHLKSKQFSGPLRNVNLASVLSVNNLSSVELDWVKRIFNDSKNIQISKYQYLYSISKIPSLHSLVEKRCLFYKDRKLPMYQVEKLVLNSELQDNRIAITDFIYCAKKTTLYINYDVRTENSNTHEVHSNFENRSY